MVFVQQGDTDVPAIPSNVLIMMQDYRKEEESKAVTKSQCRVLATLINELLLMSLNVLPRACSLFFSPSLMSCYSRLFPCMNSAFPTHFFVSLALV